MFYFSWSLEPTLIRSVFRKLIVQFCWKTTLIREVAPIWQQRSIRQRIFFWGIQRQLSNMSFYMCDVYLQTFQTQNIVFYYSISRLSVLKDNASSLHLYWPSILNFSGLSAGHVNYCLLPLDHPFSYNYMLYNRLFHINMSRRKWIYFFRDKLWWSNLLFILFIIHLHQV